MSTDDHIRQLLVETIDRELGSRLDIPAHEDQPRNADADVARPRRARWLIPAVAAAAVVIIAAGTLAVVHAVSPDQSSPAAGGAAGVEATCTAAKGADPTKDVATLISRASALAHGGGVTSSVSGNAVTVTIPGATAADVMNLCASTSLTLRPLIAPAVPVRLGRTKPVTRLTFRIPQTEAEYSRLSTKQQSALRIALSRSRCRTGAIGSSGPISSGATVACDNGPGVESVAALLGAPIVSRSEITDAVAEAPSAGSGDAEWTVSLTFTDAASHAFATYTTEYNTGGISSSVTATSCGATSGTPCSDLVGFVLNRSIVSLPLTESPIDGGSVQIAGDFTGVQAKAIAAALRSGVLPVPLHLTSTFEPR